MHRSWPEHDRETCVDPRRFEPPVTPVPNFERSRVDKTAWILQHIRFAGEDGEVMGNEFIVHWNVKGWVYGWRIGPQFQNVVWNSLHFERRFKPGLNLHI